MGIRSTSFKFGEEYAPSTCLPVYGVCEYISRIPTWCSKAVTEALVHGDVFTR